METSGHRDDSGCPEPRVRLGSALESLGGITYMNQSSPKYSELYPPGDYEWYACDALGHVAVFTTGEVGPVPSRVLSSRSVADTFAGIVKKMSPRGSASMIVSLPDPGWFSHIASCGFFAYDWHDVHRTVSLRHRYELLSRPDAPIHVTELPEQLQQLVSKTVFADLDFADSREIDVRAYFDCEPAS